MSARQSGNDGPANAGSAVRFKLIFGLNHSVEADKCLPTIVRSKRNSPLIKSDDLETILRLIDSAYLSGSGQQSWGAFANDFGHEFPQLLTVIAGYDRKLRQAEIFASANISDWSIKKYLAGYHAKNVYLQKSDAWRTLPDVTFWHEILTLDEVLESEFYRDFLSVDGPNHEAFAGVIFREEGRFLALSCNYAMENRNVAKRAASVLRTLGPHLQRAFELHRNMRGLRIELEALASSLDHLQAATMVVSYDGTLHYANAAARLLLDAGEFIRLDELAQVKFVDAEDHRKVFSELASLQSYEPPGSPKHVILTRPPEAPLRAFVSVLADRADETVELAERLLSPPRRYIVFLISTAAEIKIERIVDVLRVTPAEARLAKSLINGLSLHQHAEVHGIAYNTARTQLQSLFAKTETTSQAKLVAHMVRLLTVLG